MGLENQHVNAGCPLFVPAGGFYETGFAQYKQSDVGGTIKASGGVMGGGSETFLAQAIALAENTIGRKPENGGNGDGFTEGGPMYTLNATGVHGVAQPISFDMAQITSKVNGTRVEPGLPVSTLAKGSQMHVAMQSICLMDQGGSVMNVEHDMVGTLRRETHGHEPIVAQPVYSFIQASAQKKSTNSVLEELSNTLTARAENNNFAGGVSMAVRRLTPVECERLQGFPDTYTDIKSKGKATPDGPRYKALGNSMAVPVMAWIGNRIQQVESLKI
jgi:DNA (cytosine-5)-methyltransferase 1